MRAGGEIGEISSYTVASQVSLIYMHFHVQH